MRDTGAWKDAVVAKDETLSTEVDLGAIYSHIVVLIPTIDSALVSIQISDEVGGTFYPVHDWEDSDADNTVLLATTDGVGGIAAVFFIGGAQLIKILCSAAQTTAAVTFRVRGMR